MNYYLIILGFLLLPIWGLWQYLDLPTPTLRERDRRRFAHRNARRKNISRWGIIAASTAFVTIGLNYLPSPLMSLLLVSIASCSIGAIDLWKNKLHLLRTSRQQRIWSLVSLVSLLAAISLWLVPGLPELVKLGLTAILLCIAVLGLMTSWIDLRGWVIAAIVTSSTIASFQIQGTFAPAALAANPTISGTVFEDVNYGGGAGRSLSGASGVGRGGATVELYDSTGTLIQTTTTSTVSATLGQYSFSNVASGNYTVRVVNSTITSSRTGYTSGLIPVQTFRTDAGTTAGTVTPVTNRVGGEQPAEVDAAAGTVNTTTLTSLNAGNTEAQSVTAVQVGSSNVTGIDFGFNFDTIVNTNNSGQGSLAQFITNSNALDNSNLDQVPNPSPAAGTTAIDPPAGQETSIFMIPAAKLNSGVAVINITSLLPQITDTNANNTVIDGRTQTVNIGNTNNVTLGVGGTVGVDKLTLSQLNGPEVQITGTNSITSGLDIQANNVQVKGIAIYGFGAVSPNADINIGSAATNAVITGNVIGTRANSFTDPGSGSRSNAYAIYSSSTTGNFTNNLIGFHGKGGIELKNAGSGILIENNEVRGNAIDDSRAEGTNVLGSGGVTVRGNLFTDHGGPGIDTSGSTGNNTYVNNTVTNNGRNLTGQSDPQTSGIRIQGSNTVIDRNIIANNYGAGILARDTTSTLKITQNSIYGNGTPGTTPSGQIGIDLVATGGNGDTGTAPFVTLNDGATSGGANQLLDYPVFTSAIVNGSNLVLSGYSRPNATIELFIANPDPSGFGEGQTYLTTVTEGSAADSDSGTGSYSGTINGINQGSDSSANKFKFTIPLSALPGVSAGTKLTATATINNATSEFSGNTTVTSGANVLFVKRVTAINSDRNKNPNDNTPLNAVVDNPATTNDTNANWPSGFLVGAYNAGKIKPGDEIEYTIYFLNAGDNDARNVRICDRIIGEQTLSGNTIQLYQGGSNTNVLTTAADGDRATYYSNINSITGASCNFNTSPAADNGAVVVDVNGASAPAWPKVVKSSAPGTSDSYGFIRFTTKVNSSGSNPPSNPPATNNQIGG